MRIKSQYRKYLLALIGKYKTLPATKNGLIMLIKAYSDLENEKKIRKTYQKMQEIKLLKKTSLFKTERHNKDTIEITQKGIDTLKENGIDLEKERMSLYQKNSSLEGKQFQYKTAEADIFFRGALKTTRNLNYHSRDTIIDFMKAQGTWKDASQFKGARVNGIFDTGVALIPVYNIKDRNIKVSLTTEKSFIFKVAECLKKEIELEFDKVLLADNINILDKTILLDENTERIIKEKLKAEDEKIKANANRGISGLIFSTELKSEKLYLLLNNIEQQELAKFFEYVNFDDMVKTYLIEKNLNEIEKKQNNEKDILGTLFYNSSVYETESEIGFCIIQQELNYINRLYRLLNKERGKIEKSKKALVVYGLPCNKELYDKVFAGFPYMEFKEIEKEDLMLSLELMQK